MAFCRVPVFLPVFICHDQRSFVFHVFTHFYFMILKIPEKFKDGVFASVSVWAKRLSITPHYHIRKAAWLMLLSFYCEVLSIVWLACIYLAQNTFKVGINDLWSFPLFVEILEGHLVIVRFWHLRFSWAFQKPFAFQFVPFKQIFCFISVQTSFAKVLAFIVPVLVI